jgi:hypothetical protein
VHEKQSATFTVGWLIGMQLEPVVVLQQAHWHKSALINGNQESTIILIRIINFILIKSQL